MQKTFLRNAKQRDPHTEARFDRVGEMFAFACAHRSPGELNKIAAREAPAWVAEFARQFWAASLSPAGTESAIARTILGLPTHQHHQPFDVEWVRRQIDELGLSRSHIPAYAGTATRVFELDKYELTAGASLSFALRSCAGPAYRKGSVQRRVDDLRRDRPTARTVACLREVTGTPAGIQLLITTAQELAEPPRDYRLLEMLLLDANAVPMHRLPPVARHAGRRAVAFWLRAEVARDPKAVRGNRKAIADLDRRLLPEDRLLLHEVAWDLVRDIEAAVATSRTPLRQSGRTA